MGTPKEALSVEVEFSGPEAEIIEKAAQGRITNWSQHIHDLALVAATLAAAGVMDTMIK